MARYKLTAPLNVPMVLLIPTTASVYGVLTKTYPAIANGILIFGSLRTYGGTERDVNGVYSVENTAIAETWYRPDIASDCRIALPEAGKTYDILGEPEDIEMRHQYIRMRLIEVKGGA